jgi:hypothetical protein
MTFSVTNMELCHYQLSNNDDKVNKGNKECNRNKRQVPQFRFDSLISEIFKLVVYHDEKLWRTEDYYKLFPLSTFFQK